MKKFFKKILGKYYYDADILFGVIVGSAIVITVFASTIIGFVTIVSSVISNVIA